MRIWALSVLVAGVCVAAAAFALTHRSPAAVAVRIDPALITALPAAVAKSSADPRPAPEPQRRPGTAVAPAVPSAAVASVADAALLEAIKSALGPDADSTSVVVRRLRDGRSAVWKPEQVYYSASLFKLAVLYEAGRQRLDGRLDVNGALALTGADLDEDLGSLGSLQRNPDGSLPVQEALKAMVERSDNTSAVALARTLGYGSIDRSLAELGLRATSVNTQELPTTAADMALLMEAIVRGSGLTPALRDEMLGLLSRQETRNGIPARLPAGVRSGNKTGTWQNATHDVGFVEAPSGVYVIAVLSEAGWRWEPIAKVSRAVYEVLESGRR